MEKSKKFLALTGAVLVCIILLFSITTIPAGFVGVRTQFGAVVNENINPGLNFKIPFIQDIKKIDCRIQRLETESFAASKDLQTVSNKIVVNYAINSSAAKDIYQEIGMNYSRIIIEPAVQEVVKATTSKYTAEDLIGKRSEVSDAMKTLLDTKISSRGINVIEFNVIDFDFSAEFNSAIERKQVAQQDALKAQQELERIKIEAEQKVVQAKAEADSLKLQKQEITSELLKLREIEAQIKAIEKWDGKMPTYNGSGAMPFINVN